MYSPHERFFELHVKDLWEIQKKRFTPKKFLDGFYKIGPTIQVKTL
jgi:hypothetical protein